MLYVRDQIGKFTWTATDESEELYVVRRIERSRVAFFCHLIELKDDLDFIPKILYVGHDSGNGYCVVEEFLRGKTLREMGELYKGQYAKVSSLLIRLSSYLYSLKLYGIVHGDIKPENIMITDRTYLIDLGFSQRVDGSGRAPCLGYTPLYCSMEQLNGYVCHEVDMRALRITMLELFQGRHPFYQDVMGNPEEIARMVAESQIERCGV